ncbi:LysR family transcriptional regulator [Sciscionella sediminilitoris]|uniref:LysR family transcriptional regulator n=1 Tax=Sciscionella sediminilitoris TaxID=1445613 RepID=UPI0004DED236|nr:LysR substrate-binding domain-containing protein [Sciscionella sp. SE31]
MFDPVCLRSFVTVARMLSFTESAARLGLRQSTVSQHVRRLESMLGRQLFVRDTHRTALTPDGEALLGHASAILEANQAAVDHFDRPRPQGRVRFGASEDFVVTRLPEVVDDFRRRHPSVELELTVGLSEHLLQWLAEGELDLVFGKRGGPDRYQQRVWQDSLVWAGHRTSQLPACAPVPLVLYPSPSVNRERALETLRSHGIPYRISCTSEGLHGVFAAVRAGLGITAHARSLLPDDLVELPPDERLPDLGSVEFVLASAEHARKSPAADLRRAIMAEISALRRCA